MDLQWFYQQWIDRAGRAAFTLQPPAVTKKREGYHLKSAILQDSAVYKIKVPIRITMANGIMDRVIPVDSKKTDFEMILPGEIQQIEIDPDYHTFRKEIM
jgi:hypothetical protein